MTKKETNVNEDKEEKVEQEIVMKPETNFTSCSEEIRYYMKSRLAVEEECTKQVLIDFVKKSVREPEQLTENMFTNTLRALTDAGEIMQVARGTYRKCGSCSMKEKIAGILRKARQDISKVCTVNILNMGGKEMDMLPIVQQCLATMSETENTLSGKMVESRV